MMNLPNFGGYDLGKPNQYNYSYMNRWGRQSNLNFSLGMKYSKPVISIKWTF